MESWRNPSRNPVIDGNGQGGPASFPLIDVSGDPFERGRQYGRKAGDRIIKSLKIYSDNSTRVGLEWSIVRKLARRFVSEIDRFGRGFSDEIRGISEGAEQRVEDIVALNARTELLYNRAAQTRRMDSPSDGCTGAIVLPEVTTNKHLLHGQNWDWYEECVDSAVVLRITPDLGPRVLTFVEAGMLARCGLNSVGLALTGNFLASDRDLSRKGVPITLIRRQILESEGLASVISYVINTPRASSTNVMISHASGAAIDIETTPDEVFWLQPEHGILVHANHFKSLGAIMKIKDTGLARYPDSLYRDRRVMAHLRKRICGITVGHLKTAFKDEYGKPRSVCRHPVRDCDGVTTATVATIIMIPTERKMWVAPAPYRDYEFTEYVLD